MTFSRRNCSPGLGGVELTGQRHLDSNERVAALVGHGLQIAEDTAVGLGELGFAEAPRNLLLDLAHAQIAFGTVVGEGDVGVPGEEQHGGLVLFQALPEIVGVGFRYSAPLAVLPCRDGREFPFAAGEDVTVSALQARPARLSRAIEPSCAPSSRPMPYRDDEGTCRSARPRSARGHKCTGHAGKWHRPYR